MDWTREPEFDLSVFSKFQLFDAHGLDAASLLTANITFIWMLVAGGFLAAIQLTGEPIECLCPAEHTDAMCNYTKIYCWTSRLYVYDYDDPIPRNPDERYESAKRELAYYPLVPFILVFVACLLKTPNFFWNAFMGDEGLNIPKAVKMGLNPTRDDDEAGKAVAFDMRFPMVKDKGHLKKNEEETMKKRVDSVKLFFAVVGIFPLGSGLGAYQTGLFMFTHLLALALCVAAYPLVGYVLNTNFAMWGWDIARGLALDDQSLWVSEVFARETLCDFKVRQLMNVQDFTIQCVLPINMWSEKAFIALWFWLLLLILANAHSYQYWLRKLVSSSNRRFFVSKHLRLLRVEEAKKPRADVTKFALHYLTHDSILVLKMLETCVGNQFANTVVNLLWKEFEKSSTEESRKPPERKLSGPVEEEKTSLGGLNGKLLVPYSDTQL